MHEEELLPAPGDDLWYVENTVLANNLDIADLPNSPMRWPQYPRCDHYNGATHHALFGEPASAAQPALDFWFSQFAKPMKVKPADCMLFGIHKKNYYAPCNYCFQFLQTLCILS